MTAASIAPEWRAASSEPLPTTSRVSGGWLPGLVFERMPSARLAILPALLLSLFLAEGCRKHVAYRVPPAPSPDKAAAEFPRPTPPPPPPPAPQISESVGAPRADAIPEIPKPLLPGPAASGAFPYPATHNRSRKALPLSVPTRPATAISTPPETDMSRPRKIILQPATSLGPHTAAFKFESHPLKQGELSRFRLLIDPAPIVTNSAEDYARKHIAGTTDGSPLEIAPAMEAQLSSSDPSLRIVSEDPVNREIDPQHSTEWFWDVTPANSGRASLRLDLTATTNGEKRSVDPFPIHTDLAVAPQVPTTKQAAPAAPSRPPILPWLAIGVLALLLLLASLWFFRRHHHEPSTITTTAATTSVAPRTIIQRDDGYAYVVNVLVISHAADPTALQQICRNLADEHSNFTLPFAGFPIGSNHWQAWFSDSLDSADAILVALTADALGDKWLNWQLEKARAAQASRGIPIFVAALDDQVMKVARSIQLLEGMSCYPPTPQGQSELKATLRASEPLSTRAIRCFISYSHRHAEFASRLCKDLNHAGIRTWMDVDGIPGGTTWKRQIADAINSCTHVLFLLTDESVESEQVTAEIDWAKQQRKTVIPIMEFDVKLPFGLLGTQYVSFIKGYDAGFRRLLQDLARMEKTAHA